MSDPKPASMKVIDTQFPMPGDTMFQPITFELAEKIANDFYDVLAITPIGLAGFGIKTRAGYEACVGMVRHQRLGDCPAILHKLGDGTRLLQFLQP